MDTSDKGSLDDALRAVEGSLADPAAFRSFVGSLAELAPRSPTHVAFGYLKAHLSELLSASEMRASDYEGTIRHVLGTPGEHANPAYEKLQQFRYIDNGVTELNDNNVLRRFHALLASDLGLVQLQGIRDDYMALSTGPVLEHSRNDVMQYVFLEEEARRYLVEKQQALGTEQLRLSDFNTSLHAAVADYVASLPDAQDVSSARQIELAKRLGEELKPEFSLIIPKKSEMRHGLLD